MRDVIALKRTLPKVLDTQLVAIEGKEFYRHFRQGTKQVILHLAQSRVFHSIGMSLLIEIIERLREADEKLVFTNMDPAVEKILTIMGVFSFCREREIR